MRQLLFQLFYSKAFYQLQNILIYNMNISDASSKIYADLLDLSQLSLKQIQDRALDQNHAVCKSLLKLQASNRLTDHSQAINELKLAKSQISSFSRSSTSKQNQKIYQKIMVCILSYLTSRQFSAGKFKQSIDSLKQLAKQCDDINYVKQAIFNMFGFSSLVNLDNYNIQSNTQFKYPAESQASFFYIVGKVKMASHKIQQVKLAYEKILMLKDSVALNQFLLIRVLDCLAEVDPMRYRSQYQKCKKNSNLNAAYTKQQKQCSQTIIKTLLQKQYSLVDRTISFIQKKQKVTKKMLWMYLNKILSQKRTQAVATEQKYFHSLLNTLNQQQNPTVLGELLNNTDLSKQANQYYEKTITRMSQIWLDFYFRKIKGSMNKPSSNNIFQSNNSNQINKRFIPSASSKVGSSQVNNSHLAKSLPKDLFRAKQILKKCLLGSTLMKINYGNTSIKSKFVKIEEKQLVWADNQAEIEFSASRIKWKHVLGIVYGKVSQNLQKQKFSYLMPWRCFSLITRDRSFDFYCQDQSQIFLWLQGISYQLQIFHKNSSIYPFYSKGRALWKMSLLKMASKFKDPKVKYKCQNAGAILNYKQSMLIIMK